LVNWGTVSNVGREIYVLACIPIHDDRWRDVCCDPAGSQEGVLELRLDCELEIRTRQVASVSLAIQVQTVIYLTGKGSVSFADCPIGTSGEGNKTPG
jgi:hypothetical protein